MSLVDKAVSHLGTDIVLASLPRWPARGVTPRVVSVPGGRSPRAYDAVLDQFDVENAARYARGQYTYCNIFVWDWSRAMSAEIPHWVTSSGEPTVCQARGGHRQNANEMTRWLNTKGPSYGWCAAEEEDAVAAVRHGRPAVAAARSSEGAGHMAVLLPSSTIGAIRTAQAGVENWRDGPLRFEGRSRAFYVHA